MLSLADPSSCLRLLLDSPCPQVRSKRNYRLISRFIDMLEAEDDLSSDTSEKSNAMPNAGAAILEENMDADSDADVNTASPLVKTSSNV